MPAGLLETPYKNLVFAIQIENRVFYFTPAQKSKYFVQTSQKFSLPHIDHESGFLRFLLGKQQFHELRQQFQRKIIHAEIAVILEIIEHHRLSRAGNSADYKKAALCLHPDTPPICSLLSL